MAEKNKNLGKARKNIEVSLLPAICEDCQEEDCYNCDNALDRWKLSPSDELQLKKKLKQKAIERLEREIAEIDRKLAKLA